MEIRSDVLDEAGTKITKVLDDYELEVPEAVVLLTSILAMIHKDNFDVQQDIFWEMITTQGMRFSDDLKNEGVHYEG